MIICLTGCCKCVRANGVSISVMTSSYPAPSDYQPGPYSVMCDNVKRLAIINQFWLVKSGNRFNMSTPTHKGVNIQ